MKEVIVSIGMGPGQLDFISRLKDLGYTIIAFGKGKNSKRAMDLCDYIAEIDTRDFYGAVKWIDSLPVKVIAVGSFAGGAAVTTVQKIANYYNVCTAVPDELVVGSDKIKQQKLYVKYGLSSIRTWKIKEINKNSILDSDVNNFILKPAVGRGSEGILFLDKNELVENMGLLNEEDIIQEVREGDEYRCVIIVQNGEVKLLAPIIRKSYRNTVFLGILSYSQKHYERLFDFMTHFIIDSKINNSIIKADIIVSEKSIDVIEMDIGVGGGSYYKTFVSRIYDRNLMDEYIKLVYGMEVQPFKVKFPMLTMEYVYNHNNTPVYYDVEECQKFYEQKFGKCEIQVNKLHPETKGGYASNSDFIFTVMHENQSKENCFLADDLANEFLLHKEEKNDCC